MNFENDRPEDENNIVGMLDTAIANRSGVRGYSNGILNSVLRSGLKRPLPKTEEAEEEEAEEEKEPGNP